MQIRITRPCPLRQLIPILMLEHVLQSGVVQAILGFAIGCGLEKAQIHYGPAAKNKRLPICQKNKNNHN